MKGPKRGLTRRGLAAAFAATPLLAQAPAAQQTDELAAARESAKRNAAQIRKHQISTLAEPSFVFKP
jgi:hypothetical protein